MDHGIDLSSVEFYKRTSKAKWFMEVRKWKERDIEVSLILLSGISSIIEELELKEWLIALMGQSRASTFTLIDCLVCDEWLRHTGTHACGRRSNFHLTDFKFTRSVVGVEILSSLLKTEVIFPVIFFDLIALYFKAMTCCNGYYSARALYITSRCRSVHLFLRSRSKRSEVILNIHSSKLFQ